MKTTHTWKTVTIGGKEKYTFGKEIYLSGYAEDLQRKTPLATKKETLDLVVLTPQDLGFTYNPTTTELFDEKNLAKYGVELCPAEVGLALREQYTDQPYGEWLYGLYVGMEPITISVGNPSVWRVGRSDDGGLWLGTRWVNPGIVWDPDDRIVFRLRTVSVSSALPAESSDEASLASRIAALEADMAKIKNLFT